MLPKLIWITPESEKLIAYCARVSNPTNQETDKIEGLLKYCIKNNHWSIFEMASMCVEISTSRAISAQILRHRSFSFQEFSQRYSAVQTIENVELRRQDLKNRQNSTSDLSPEVAFKYKILIEGLQSASQALYASMLADGIAKECARMVLPMAASTRLYMNGSVRSWIHYLQLRTGNGTQLEHKIIAEGIKQIFITELPIIASILDWS